MNVLQEQRLSPVGPCPYLPGRLMRMRYFFAFDVNGEELDALLSSGWRKFGLHYFRPDCEGCAECVPIRIDVNAFKPDAGQRRVARMNTATVISFGELGYSEDAFDVYQNHSRIRFGKEPDREEFAGSFCTPSCPCMMSQYRIDDRLAAVGFLDISTHGLSSVYFAFHTDFSRFRLGSYSVIREVMKTQETGLSYYYLGYCISGNKHMSYKNSFKPNQKMDWNTGTWSPESL